MIQSHLNLLQTANGLNHTKQHDKIEVIMPDIILNDFKPVIHNGTGVYEEELWKQHENLINEGNYSDAAALIKNNNLDGVTASLFNFYEENLDKLDRYLQTKELYDPYVYSPEEPDAAEMEGKMIWQQEY